MIDFSYGSPNQLLLNPKLAAPEKAVLTELQGHFEKLFGDTGYFLIPSSGSSRQSFESVKLIALKKVCVLNSARRFISYFGAGSDDNWGLVLPEFHVAGLGILARAHLAGASAVKAEWPVPHLGAWIERNKISYLSLVPAQIYDLVQTQQWSPRDFKTIFVGAGALNSILLEQVQKLGWNVLETFGMTETASMVAVKKGEHYEFFPGVQAQVPVDVLQIQCDSLLSASVQKINDVIELKNFENVDWYETRDTAEMVDARHFRFLGRKDDYVKILGEGVSLSELRDVLLRCVLLLGENPAAFELVSLEDERAGARLFLAAEGGVDYRDVLIQYNKSCRPFEKIGDVFELAQIPRTALGKLKRDELNSIIKESLTKGSYGES